MMIGQTPARLDAKERSAIGPQRHIWHAGKIDNHPAAAGRIDVGKFASWNIDKFENDGAGQLWFRERHFAAGEFEVAGFAGEIIVRRKMAAIQAARHLQMKCLERSRGKTRMQSEFDMRGQLGLVISKCELNTHLVQVDLVG